MRNMCKNSHKTYWNNNGKYQQFVTETNKIMPDYGDTSNLYMNLFIGISKLYYDCYNNGGCNIFDCYMDKVEKIQEKVGKIVVKRLINDNEYLESITNKVMEYLLDKDLSYEKTTYYFFHDKTDELYYHSRTFHENWDSITFGLKDEAEKWLAARLKWKDARLIS